MQREVVNAMQDAVREMQRQHHLFPLAPSTAHAPQPRQASSIIVGVSGGADSVCLLHLLYHLAPEWQLVLHVAHLDHALRPDSADDAAFVAQLAESWNLPFHYRRLEPGELAASTASLESAARHARQQFLAEVALHHTPVGQIPTVALAHHADDQAETVLHHLVRGSGLQGLAGMRPVTALTLPPQLPASATDDAATVAIAADTAASTIAESRQAVIHLVRPLLYVRRATILQYLQMHGLSWREDSTNQEQQYTRNYIRHTVLPALTQINPAVVEAVGRMATLAHEEVTRLRDYDQELLTRIQLSPAVAPHGAQTTDNPPLSIVLDLDALRLLPAPTQRALLRMVFDRLTPGQGELSFAQIDALVVALPAAVSGGPHPLVASLMWSVAGATSALPARLSLHHKEALPFLPDQPLLAVGERISLPPVTTGESLHLNLNDGWQLSVTAFPCHQLPPDWRSGGRPWRAFFDADRVGQPILTTWVVGQQFAPLGMGGQQKALGDFFTDRKIPATLRLRWPLFVDAATDTVLWVCGLQPAHPACITDRTERVLQLSFG